MLKLHFLDVEAFDDGNFFVGVIPASLDNNNQLVKQDYKNLNKREIIEYLKNLNEEDIVVTYNESYDLNAIWLAGIENYNNKVINDILIRSKNKDKKYKYSSSALSQIGGKFKTYDAYNIGKGKLKIVARQNGFQFTSSSVADVENYNIEDIESTIFLFDKKGGLDEIKAYLFLLKEYNLQNIRCLSNNLIVSQIMNKLGLGKQDIGLRITNFLSFYINFLKSINHPVATARLFLDDELRNYKGSKSGEKKISKDISVGKYLLSINKGGLHAPSGTVLNNKVYYNVISGDFASLYPTCYTSKYMPIEVIPENTKEDSLDLIEERIAIKKTDPVKSHALKIILNTLYGQLKDDKNNSLTPIVTVLAQMALIDLLQGLYDIDNNILFIDYNTDGIYFKTEKREECIKFCEEYKSNWTNGRVSKVEVEEYEVLYYQNCNNYVFLNQGKVVKGKGTWVSNKKLAYTFNKLTSVKKGEDRKNEEKTFNKIYATYDSLSSHYDDIVQIYTPKVYNFKQIIQAGLEGKKLPPAKMMAGYKTSTGTEYFDVNIDPKLVRSDEFIDLFIGNTGNLNDHILISKLKDNNYKAVFSTDKRISNKTRKIISEKLFERWLSKVNNELDLSKVYVVASNKTNPKADTIKYLTHNEALEEINKVIIVKSKSRSNDKLIKLELKSITGLYVYDLDFKYIDKTNSDYKDKDLKQAIKDYKNNFNILEEFFGDEDYCIEYNNPKDMVDKKSNLKKKHIRFGCHIYLSRKLEQEELSNLEKFINNNFKWFKVIEDKSDSAYITLYQSKSKNSLTVPQMVEKYAEFDIKSNSYNCLLSNENLEFLNHFFKDEEYTIKGNSFQVKCRNAEHSNNPLSLGISFNVDKKQYVCNCFVCDDDEKSNKGNFELINQINKEMRNFNNNTIENNDINIYLDDRGTGTGKSYTMAKRMLTIYKQDGHSQIVSIFPTKNNMDNMIGVIANVKGFTDKEKENFISQIRKITADSTRNTTVLDILKEEQPRIIFILGCYFKEFIKGIDDKFKLQADMDQNHMYNKNSLYKPLKEVYKKATLFIDEADLFIIGVISRVFEMKIRYEYTNLPNAFPKFINIAKLLEKLFSENGYKFQDGKLFDPNNKELKISETLKNALTNWFKIQEIKKTKAFKKIKELLPDGENGEIAETNKADTDLKNIIKCLNNPDKSFKPFKFYIFDKIDLTNGETEIFYNKQGAIIDLLDCYFSSIGETLLSDKDLFEFINHIYKVNANQKDSTTNHIGLGVADNSKPYYVYRTNDNIKDLLNNWKGDIYLATATAKLVKYVFPNYQLTYESQIAKELEESEISKGKITKIYMGGYAYKKLMEYPIDNLHWRLSKTTLFQHLHNLCLTLHTRGSKITAESMCERFNAIDIKDIAFKNQIGSTILSDKPFKNIKSYVAYLRHTSLRGSNDYGVFPLFFFDINTVGVSEVQLNAIDVENIYNLKTSKQRTEYANNIIEEERQQAYGRMDRGDVDKLAFIFLSDSDRKEYIAKNGKNKPLKDKAIEIIHLIEEHLNYTLFDKLDTITQDDWNKIPNDPTYAEVYNYFKEYKPEFLNMKL